METTKLYGGEVELLFDPDKHHYTVDGKTVDGVTSVLQIISKPALVYWSANMASKYVDKHLRVGEVVDEVQKKNLVDGSKTAHRTMKTEAGDIGTMFHNWVEDHINGKNPKLPTNLMLKKAVEQFLGWVKEKKVEFKSCERKIYSKKYNYAGTVDFTAIIDGKRVVGDLKTSSGIWDEYWLQVAAYKQALTEEFPEVELDHCVIVRCGKDGSFEVKEMNNFKQNIKTFVGALELYRGMKELKQLTKKQ